MEKMVSKLIVLSLLVLITGCAPRYACRELIPGAKCISLSETYAQEVLGRKSVEIGSEKDIDYSNETKIMSNQNTDVALIVESPSQNAPDKQRKLQSDKKEIQNEKGITENILGADKGIPILRPPRIARIWLSPWIDSNGDLYMESFIYTEIEGKKWVIGNDMPGISKESLERSYNPLK